MKKLIFVAALLLAGWTTAHAASVPVDFSVLGSNTVSIVAPENLVLSGVAFTYDNFGSGAFAAADQVGIYGEPNNGVLNLSFGTPVYGLSFIYGNFSDTGGSLPDALVGLFSNTGSLTDVVVKPGTLNEFASFDYHGQVFDNASFYFSTSATIFTADHFVYQTTPVPEPATALMLLFGIASVGMAGYRRKSLR